MVDYSAYHWAKKAKQWAESIGTVLHYKGSVATYADLPSSDQQVGDMWNVLADGANYAWDGTSWDALSGIVDLSEYRTSADQDLIDAGKQPTLTTGTGINISSANVISVTSPTLTNVSTGTNSLSVLGAATVDSAATSIGVSSTAGTNGTSLGKSANSVNGGLAIGTYSKASGSWSTAVGNGNSLSNTAEATASGAIALGHNAHATASNAIQIFEGTNSTADSLQVKTYELLDTSTGLIPDARISTNIARTSAIPTVNNATLTIQKNGTTVDTFTANASSNVTANITVPTQASDVGAVASNAAITGATKCKITYDSKGLVTGGADLSSLDVTTALGYTPYNSSNPNGYTSNVGTVTSVNNTSPDGNGNVTLSIPTVNNSTITIQKNGTTVDSFTTNASSNKSINITVPTSAADVSALPSSTKYGANLSYSSNTLQLKDQDGNNLGSAVTISGGGSLPSQTGNSGKFLTTDGTDASWAVPKTNDLFDFKWTDYELNDQNWLRADTYSWQDGTVYSDAYNHLVDDVDGKTATTETVNGTTVTYYLADDGHKIVKVADVSAIETVYSSTGVAWYYVLDTTNQRFKLPRTKYGFTGYRDAVGKYVEAGLPNIEGYFYNGYRGFVGSTSGAFHTTGWSKFKDWGSTGTVYNYDGAAFDASRSSSIYGNSTTVQPPATQMYLYFYVGQFSQTATEQTAGLNSELFNGKVDLDAANLSTAGKSLISGLGMPSSRYNDLTLGASGTQYTAPANGWFTCACTGTAGSTYFELIIDGNKASSTASYNGGWARASVPAEKGDVLTIYYGGNNFTKQFFRFIYAEGEE